MATGVNRVTLLGNLGKDPEMRTTPQGNSVCTIRIATSEKYKDKNGEWQEATEWHNVVLWDWLAERAEKYLRKGNRVYIEGKLKTHSYEKNNEKKYVTEVVAQNMVFLTPTDTEKEVSYDSAHTNEIDDIPF